MTGFDGARLALPGANEEQASWLEMCCLPAVVVAVEHGRGDRGCERLLQAVSAWQRCLLTERSPRPRRPPSACR